MGNLGYGAYPTHPGEVLKDEIEERGISQRKLADSMGLTYSVVNEILNGHRPLTAKTALMFEAALDVPADSLMYLQTKYNMQMARKDSALLNLLKDIKKWRRYSIKIMRLITFLLFLALILGGVSYAVWHVWCVLPAGKAVKSVVVAVLLALLFSMFFFLGGRLDRMPLQWASPVYEVATSGIFVLLYTVILFIVLDVLTLCRVMPREWLHHNGWTTAAIVGVLVVIFVGGNLHYRHKYRQVLSLKTEKPLKKPLKIVMMSDLHLGYHNRRAEMARWVDLINKEKADLIVIAGDIIDISVLLPGGAPKDHFTILLDHQPYHLEEAQQCGIDLQMSGHTHYGQVWPISWITDAIYEIAFGEGQRGDTHYYVSSGMGIWGGKYRIGTRSEYVVVEIEPLGKGRFFHNHPAPSLS